MTGADVKNIVPTAILLGRGSTRMCDEWHFRYFKMVPERQEAELRLRSDGQARFFSRPSALNPQRLLEADEVDLDAMKSAS